MEVFKVSKNGKEKWAFYYLNPETGKRQLRVCRNCKTEEDAIEYTKILGKKKQNPYLIKNLAADMFVEGGEHLRRIAGFGKELAKETVTQRRSVIKQIIKVFGEKDISKLMVRDIESFLINDSSHSGSWKNFYLETFSCIYEETKWKCDKCIEKPHFHRFTVNYKKADVLTAEELKLVFNPVHWDNKDEWLFFVIIASCGLRLGEMRAVKVNQILFNEKVLIVNGFCKRDGKRTTYNKKGSPDNDKVRVIPIPDFTLNLIHKRIEKNDLFGEDYLFSTAVGEPYDQVHCEYIFRKVVKRAGVDTAGRKLVPHSLRYTYVTRMRRGLPVEDVKRIVGHSSAEMTDYYTRSTIPELIEAISGSFECANLVFD